MNPTNSTIELFSSFQPEIRHGRDAFYLQPGRGKFYSVYLIYFMNGIRFG